MVANAIICIFSINVEKWILKTIFGRTVAFSKNGQSLKSVFHSMKNSILQAMAASYQ